MMQKLAKDSLQTSSILLVEEILSVIFKWIQQNIDFSQLSELEKNRQLGILTTNISSFVEISTLSAKYNRLNSIDFKENHISLLFIVKAINHAVMKSDWIALEELIKYELKDNLTQWKINLIPLIKKTK